MKTRAVIVEVGKIPVVREIEGFEEAKKIIGGHIQRVRMGKYDCLCDEDGGPKGLAPNRFSFIFLKVSLKSSARSWISRALGSPAAVLWYV
jgi:hypothetical protein